MIEIARNGRRPVHPGEVLREDYLIRLGLSATALARALGVTPARVNDILREGDCGPGSETACRGGPWLNPVLVALARRRPFVLELRALWPASIKAVGAFAPDYAPLHPGYRTGAGPVP